MQKADAIARVSTSRWLLILGLVGGAAVTAYGLMDHGPSDDLTTNNVALVNQRPISRDAWLRAVAAVASERNIPLAEGDKRHILDRLIDEELLVQYGIKLGLPEQDGRIRSQLVSEVMLIARNSKRLNDDEASLLSFYENNKERFTSPMRMRVSAWRLDSEGKRQNYLPSIPNSLLPASKMQNYLGPDLTARAANLPLNKDSEIYPIGNDRVVLRVLEREPLVTRPFEEIKDLVRVEAARHADELGVIDLLGTLRKSNKVVVAKDLP